MLFCLLYLAFIACLCKSMATQFRNRAKRHEEPIQVPRRRSDRHLRQRPEKANVVGVNLQEPFMTYSLLNALAPYADITNDSSMKQTSVADEIERLESTLPVRPQNQNR